MDKEQQALQALREKIDTLDQQLQRLLNQRATLAQQVAEIKIAHGHQGDFYRPEREARVLSAIKQNNQGPLSDDAIATLFREIMSACLAVEKPLSVAFLGPIGSYTEIAAQKQFGHAVGLVAESSIEEIFHAVASRRVDYGVVPVENSTEGAVRQTLDCFLSNDIGINGEVLLPIHHALLALTPTLSEVEVIYGHEQALAQCRQWLQQHCPQCEQVSVKSNAYAVKKIALTQQNNAAAIADERAAKHYDLQVIARHIEDKADNTTRFLVIGHQRLSASGQDKTSLLVATENQPGALHQLLTPFAEHGIMLTGIESRPSKQGQWQYVFFIDVEGHYLEPALQQVLETIEKHSLRCQLLGSYPKAIL
ncbi:MAG TPA: prephenate dehydratase [Gammaproteobacteria bacterium]|nr:prephenate dehydratase [Gammaproteobacteria bacterium]